MPRFIAFLRAINVGGARTVKMNILCDLFESLGFSRVTTFIASGNVVFETTSKNAKRLESKVARKLREGLGYPVEAFIRTEAELARVANFKAFRESDTDSVAQSNIIFMAEPLDERSKNRVMALQTDTDEFRVHGREIYWLRRIKPGASTFSTVPFEKALDRPFTIRSSKTVKAMAEKYCSMR
jgi:uncharacterized protein (DUF1697 family)